MRKDGTLWVNIGDSYNGSGRGRNANGEVNFSVFSSKQATNQGSAKEIIKKKVIDTCKPKDLIGIPWMLAFALRGDGWYLRQDIIWDKSGNCFPESIKDRCTKAHEYIFLLSKRPHYYYNADAIKEPVAEVSIKRAQYGWHGKGDDGNGNYAGLGHVDDMRRMVNEDGRNKRDVWHVNTSSCREAHFATFPEKLIEPCILAGSPIGGVVLDPFFGSGTTGRVATKFNRDYIGIELNPEYIKIAETRANIVQLSLLGLGDENECG